MLWHVYASVDYTTGLCEIGYCLDLARRTRQYERAHGWPVGSRHDIKLLAVSRTRAGAHEALTWCVLAWRTYRPHGHNTYPGPKAAARAQRLSPKALSRTPNGGYMATEATRAKISRAHKGRPSPLKGVPRPDEVRAKISARLKGRTSPTKGRPHTAEEKARVSAALKGRKHTPTARENMRQAHLRRRQAQTDAAIGGPDSEHVLPLQL